MLSEKQKADLIQMEKHLRDTYPIETLGDEEQGKRELSDVEAFTKKAHDNPIVKEYLLNVLKSQEAAWKNWKILNQ